MKDEEDEEEQAQYLDQGEECSSETGCCMVFREADGATLLPKPLLYEDDPENGIRADDPDYEYRSGSDDELLEYDSGACDGEDLDDEDVIMDLEEDTDEPEWTFKVSGPDHPEYDTEFLPLSTKLGDQIWTPNDDGTRTMNQEAYMKSRCFEHIAGPGCRNREGYLGRNISVEEMRGCHTVQCLIMKNPDWEPRGDDLEFERESQFHLTGVTESMPSSGYGLKFAPIRHGIDNIQAQSESFFNPGPEELAQTGLPFHPTCFELFIQASKRYMNNKVDIDGLVHIRDTSCLQQIDFPVIHNEHVDAGKEQCWIHNVGHEYLVTNPIFVPSFKPIVEAAVSTEASFSVQNSPFESRNRTIATARSQDPFLALPIEIILSIIKDLGSTDIATMRLSSRAFTHLPISVWHRLVIKELPWLYEAWSSDPTPYYWATVIARDLHKEKESHNKWERDMEEQSLVILEDMPEVHAEWLHSRPKWTWPDLPDRQEVLDLSPVKLGYHTTNWYSLYRGITVNWKQLKGLQNRERIWDAVLQVVGAIREHRGGRRYEYELVM
ncbi:hypothetical protein BDV23DRAFT_178676 [Aspergillus alliaceus]|uniref:F-box domain-containing protein n=1 Tax=Petromyces alliaceus TaxID=209559 RepID=A0A5N7CN77_PETAA|nr:hypothetical protein BDV23DRAFT_178676 [Aspergillus alliaceus]